MNYYTEEQIHNIIRKSAMELENIVCDSLCEALFVGPEIERECILDETLRKKIYNIIHRRIQNMVCNDIVVDIQKQLKKA
jgi:hypothetical protein